MKQKLTCEMCAASFEFPTSHWSVAQKLEKLNNHYCQKAERNSGHFVRYDIRDESNWLIKTIKDSQVTSPSYTHTACVSEHLCIPGKDRM